jgi:hypothetical protein
MARSTYFPGTRAVLVPVGRFTPRPGRTVVSIVRDVLIHRAAPCFSLQQGFHPLQQPHQLLLQAFQRLRRVRCAVLCVLVAVRAPTAGGLLGLHGCWFFFPSAGATVRATGVVVGGLGAGVIPLCKLPCGCLRRCPGAVPPGLRLRFVASHPGRTAPGVVFVVVGTRVAGLANARSFLPIVAQHLRPSHGGRCELRLPRRLGRLRCFPSVHLLPHADTHPVPCLVPQLAWPGEVPRPPAFTVPVVCAERGVLCLPFLRPLGAVDAS